MSFTIHWTSIAWTLVAVGSIAYADAQIPPRPLLPALQPVPPTGAFQPATIVADPKLGLGRPLGEPVVLRYEPGGRINLHRLRFLGYQREGAKVELRGGCYSACTLITGYVPKDRLCVGEGAFLAFHSALQMDYRTANMDATLEMYLTYPKHIRDWIDEKGGPTKLTPTGWWVLYDRNLWAMGYPQCR